METKATELYEIRNEEIQFKKYKEVLDYRDASNKLYFRLIDKNDGAIYLNKYNDLKYDCHVINEEYYLFGLLAYQQDRRDEVNKFDDLDDNTMYGTKNGTAKEINKLSQNYKFNNESSRLNLIIKNFKQNFKKDNNQTLLDSSSMDKSSNTLDKIEYLFPDNPCKNIKLSNNDNIRTTEYSNCKNIYQIKTEYNIVKNTENYNFSNNNSTSSNVSTINTTLNNQNNNSINSRIDIKTKIYPNTIQNIETKICSNTIGDTKSNLPFINRVNNSKVFNLDRTNQNNSKLFNFVSREKSKNHDSKKDISQTT